MIGYQVNVRNVVLDIANMAKGKDVVRIVVEGRFANMAKGNNVVRIVMADKLAYIRKWQIGVQFVTQMDTLGIC